MSSTPRTDFCSPPGQEDQSARLAASAEVDQVVDTPKLPIEVPESDTLWQLLTGCSLNHVRSCLMCGDPELEQDADRVRQAAHAVWAQIRSEVGA